LNLKLFSFLTSSNLESRHEVHKLKFKELCGKLNEKIDSKDENLENFKEVLINLFFGFQGTKNNRAWCAQSFLPLCKELLAYESIWPKVKQDLTWDEALKEFDFSKHNFMARGGEVIYLQICAALTQDQENIEKWLSNKHLENLKVYADTKFLRTELNSHLKDLLNKFSSSLGSLANFIDQELTKDTKEFLDNNFGPRKAGYCNKNSWQEGFLFAIEILRICKAELDPVDKINVLITGFALQVLRSLAAQSSRVHEKIESYYWVLSPIQSKNNFLKLLSQKSYALNERIISDALREEKIRDLCIPNFRDDKEDNKSMDEADNKYGHKLFRKLGKKIRLVYPINGPGTRFVLSDSLLRYFVMATIEPGKKKTVDNFITLLKAHFQILLGTGGLEKAKYWLNLNNTITTEDGSLDWLYNMLKASGMLIKLSDSCSLIKNPFGGEGN
jgi:hypothetical protein